MRWFDFGCAISAWRTTALVTILFIAPLASAAADPIVLYSSAGYGGDPVTRGATYLYNTIEVGQDDQASPFALNKSAILTGLELQVGLLGGPNELDIWLMADSGGSPGPIIESFRLSGLMETAPPEFEGAYMPVTARSVQRPRLIAGQNYYVGVTLPELGSTAAWANYLASLDDFRALFYRFAPSKEWVRQQGSNEAAFRVFGEVDPAPVPEPATRTLLGVGLAATGWRARRRRAQSKMTDGGSL